MKWLIFFDMKKEDWLSTLARKESKYNLDLGGLYPIAYS